MFSNCDEGIGGRFDRCRKTEHEGIPFSSNGTLTPSGALSFVLAAPAGVHDQCFYFWWLSTKLPGGSVMWVALDSPLFDNKKKSIEKTK
jgi:hypothetical protein